jgi:hypothetical protein
LPGSPLVSLSVANPLADPLALELKQSPRGSRGRAWRCRHRRHYRQDRAVTARSAGVGTMNTSAICQPCSSARPSMGGSALRGRRPHRPAAPSNRETKKAPALTPGPGLVGKERGTLYAEWGSTFSFRASAR